MSGNVERFAMVKQSDVDKLINQTALRDMQIRSFWVGLSYAKMDRAEKIGIVCDRFGTGNKNVEKIIRSI